MVGIIEDIRNLPITWTSFLGYATLICLLICHLTGFAFGPSYLDITEWSEVSKLELFENGVRPPTLRYLGIAQWTAFFAAAHIWIRKYHLQHLDEEERAYIGCYLISSFHAMVSGPVGVINAISFYNAPAGARFGNYNAEWSSQQNISWAAIEWVTGYFIVDLLYMAFNTHYRNIIGHRDNVIHHLVVIALCFFVGSTCSIPFHGAGFMMMEMSTPFLNMFRIMRKFEVFPSLGFAFQMMFVVNFLIFRTLTSWIFPLDIGFNLDKRPPRVSFYAMCALLVGAWIMEALQWFWTVMILCMLKRELTKGTDDFDDNFSGYSTDITHASISPSPRKAKSRHHDLRKCSVPSSSWTPPKQE